MSANLLIYAKKRNEVADDLESVVYVISEGFLRFHPHSYSLPSVGTSKQSEEIAGQSEEDVSQLGKHPVTPKRVPTANARLTQYLSSTFYEAAPIQDGKYFVGGQGKLQQIREGQPSYQLLSNADGTNDLQEFLVELYGLLKRHYDAIAPEELSPYLVSDHPAHLPDDGLSSLLVPAKIPDDYRALLSKPSNNTPPPVYVNNPRKPVSSTSERVLDTHQAMLRTFLNFLYSPVTHEPRTHSLFARQKDQFRDLPRNIHKKSAGPSKGCISSQTARDRVWGDIQPVTARTGMSAGSQHGVKDVFNDDSIVEDLSHLSTGGE